MGQMMGGGGRKESASCPALHTATLLGWRRSIAKGCSRSWKEPPIVGLLEDAGIRRDCSASYRNLASLPPPPPQLPSICSFHLLGGPHPGQ